MTERPREDRTGQEHRGPERRGRERPLGRLVLCLGILLLGVLSASRLELSYLPSWSFPELSLELSLPEISEVDEVTRLYVQPLESAIRALGDVTSSAGEVTSSGAWLRLRFRAGTDSEQKAARLESELTALRRRLPARARLEIWPAGRSDGDMSAVLWIEEESETTLDRSFVEALRALAEVRAVEVVGEGRTEISVTAGHGVEATALRRALGEHLDVRRLGETVAAKRRHAVYVEGPSRAKTAFAQPQRRGEALLPLDRLAEIRLHEVAPPRRAHRQGRPGRVLVIHREFAASPLALERALRRTLGRFGLLERAHFILNEAAPLKLLLKRVALGFSAATLGTAFLALVLVGARTAAAQLLFLPVALAAALVALEWVGLSLDVTTLPMLPIALGWCLFFPTFRQDRKGGAAAAILVAAALLLPVSAALAGGRVAPLFKSPTLAFLTAQVAAVVALAVVPLAAGSRRRAAQGASARGAPRPPRILGRALRFALRQPFVVLLGTLTISAALFVLFGSTLAPRPGRLSPATADLRVTLRFAEGTTPQQAQEQVRMAERELTRREEVKEHWSYFSDRWAVIDTDLAPGKRSAEKTRRLAARLRETLHSLGAAARVTALAAGGSRQAEPVRFTDSLEDRPETDRGAIFYRFLLKSTDLETLRRTHARATDRLGALSGIDAEQIQSDWGRVSVRVELSPRPGTSQREIEAALGVLRERAARPGVRELPSTLDVDLRVLDARAPRTRDDVRARHDLLGPQRLGEDVLVPEALFETREVAAAPSVKRQVGRYVLPVTVFLPGILKRYSVREEVDRALRALPMPTGCDLELPKLSTDFFSPERRRMLAIAGTLPLLLWALAAVCRNSPWRGAAAILPLFVGLATATPLLRAAQSQVDEMTLFSLAAIVVGGLPLAISIPAAGRRAEDYRWLLRHSFPFLIAALGMVLLLAVPTIGVDANRHPWVLPLRLSAVAGAASFLGSVFCLPALLRAVEHGRSRKRRAEERRAVAAAWRAPGDLVLGAEGLIKVYGDGCKALSGLDFELGPGIVGLLGPNGAGKTTLLRTLSGLIEPTRGRVHYRGVAITPDNLPEYRRLVGFLPQDFNAYEGFTGAAFLDYWALEKGLLDPRVRRREIEHRLVQVGLEEAGGRKVREYSGGMRRRIGIARALLGDPPIVIVDEPTTGLDVTSRSRLRESLLSVAGERVILFSTHIASDVAAAAARILLLHGGRLLYDGPARGLIERAHGLVFETMVSDEELREFSHRYRVTTRIRTLSGIRVRAVAPRGEAAPGEVVEPNLEEAYLAIIGTEGWRRRERLGRSLLDLESWRVA